MSARALPRKRARFHDGLVPGRLIHGQASIGDARALIEEGVPVLPVPPSPDEYN